MRFSSLLQVVKCYILVLALLVFCSPVAAAVVSSVQSGVALSTGNGTVTVPIAAVDPAKSFLVFQTRHNSNRPPGSMLRGRIASATSLEFVRVSDETSNIQIQWYVVEFTSGVRVQRGSINQTSTTMNVSLPSAVASVNQAFVSWSKTPGSGDQTWSEDDPLVAELTSTTNLQFRVNNANTSHVIWWQVIEFTNAADINVQKGSTSLIGGTLSVDVTLSTPVDVNHTFVLVGFRTSSTGADAGERMIRARLIDSTTIRIDRAVSGDNLTEIVWQAVELNDGTTVQGGSSNLATGISQSNVPITSVDTNRAIAFASVQPVGGQNMGRTPYTGDDIIGVGSVTMALAPSQITLERSTAVASTDIAWFVVEFSGVDHFAISHDGGADICKVENIIITRHDPSHAVDTNYSGTISLSTSTNNGDWSLALGSGTFSNAGNGAGSYTFVASDNGQVTLGLRNTVNETLNIDVTDGAASEHANEDPDLNFSATVSGTFRDEFTASSFSNNHGTLTWSAAWIESDVLGAGPNSGNVQITGGVLRLDDNPNTDTDPSLAREADLSAFSAAIFSFDFQTIGGVDPGDSAFIEVSSNGGGSWTLLEDITGINDTTGSRSYDISSHISSNTRIRFRINGLNGTGGTACCYGGAGEQFLVDNVQIQGSAPVQCSADHFTIIHDGAGIHCVGEPIAVTPMDSSSAAITDYAETIVLDTQTGTGSWTATTGNGTLTDATANDGVATYIFSGTESMPVNFTLYYPQGSATFNIDVYESAVPTVRDDDTEGDISFLPNGFTVTPNPLGNPPGAILAVPTQTAGAAFALYITAYGQTPSDPSCGVIETYTGIKALKLWSTYNNPLTGSTAATIDGAAIATTEAGAIAQNVSFNLGQASVTAKYKDVGRIQIDLKDDSPSDPDLPNGIGGGSGLFVVKPAGFTLSNILLPSTAGDCAGGGALLNPIPANETGAPLIRAGEAFCVTVTARDAEGDVTLNYGQEGPPEDVTLTPALSIACTGCSNNPAIGFSTGFSFSNGVGVGSDFSWGEVGIMTLTPRVGDGDYLAAGDVIGTTSGNIGRFYPHDFNVTLDNSPSFSSVCGIFTYLEQQFDYDVAPSITITARNRSGSVTQNYDGIWWKLADFTETLSQDASIPLPAGVALDSGMATHTPIDCSAGTCDGLFTSSFSGPLTYTKGASASAPFNALIDISLSIVDADGAAYGTNPFIIDNIGFTAGNAEQRYGRLALTNAHGSELLDLAVPLAVQYFAGSSTGFVSNTADNCTLGITLALSDLDSGDNLEPELPNLETCVWDDAGTTGSFSCTPPGPIASQFVQPPLAGAFNLNLRAPGAGNTGVAGVTALAPAWLKYNWQGTGNQDPTSRATFGIYNTNTPIIFMRELR